MPSWVFIALHLSYRRKLRSPIGATNWHLNVYKFVYSFSGKYAIMNKILPKENGNGTFYKIIRHAV